MNVRSVTVILLALICGFAAVLGVKNLNKPSGTVETTPLLVLSANVPRGRMLTADVLQVKDWPTEFLPANALTSIESALGRATITPLIAGEPLVEGKLAAKESGRGLAALVPRGMRAYTVQTSRIAASVAGFILPGNRVDVLMALHGNPNDGSGGGSTTTLLQAVEILAVDQRLDAPAENRIDPKDKGSVTLLVTPEQASLLDLGQSMGALTLSLRNMDDLDQEETRPATLADLRLWRDRLTSNVTAVEPEPVVEPAPPEPTKKEPEISEIRTMRGPFSGKVMVAR